MTVADPSSETPKSDAPEGADRGIPPASSTTDAIAASSTATETDAKPAEGDKPKEGEGAGDAPKPASLLEKVKADLDKGKGAAPSAADAKTVQPEPGKDGQPAAKPEGDKPKDETEVPQEFSKHPRWIALAKARDDLKPAAENWNRFNELVRASGFGDNAAAEAWMNNGARLNQAGVTSKETDILVTFAEATHRDPGFALKIITPIYNALRGIVGEGDLPKDLADQVAAGELTEDHARRIVKADADKAIAEHKATRESEGAKQLREQREATEAAGTMANAVFSWESRMATTEPDWARIAPLVNEQVELLREVRQPKTAEDAVKVCNEAVERVKRTIGVVAPAKQAVAPPLAAPSTRQQETPAKDVYEHVKRKFAPAA